jgi:hypothetical protein
VEARMDEVMGRLKHLQGEIDRLGAQLASEHESREKLERTLKITRWLVVATLLLILVFPFAARWLPVTFRTVRARELVVQDAQGKTRVQILADGDNASVVVNEQAGEPGVVLATDALHNMMYVASRSPKPSTGIRLESSKDFTNVTLHHQVPAPGKNNLSGWVQLESAFQDDARINVYAADGGHVQLEGSGIVDAGARMGLWPGPREGVASSWLVLESQRGRPALELVEMGGMSARLDISNGPQLTLNGPFGSRGSATLGIHTEDKGGMLILSSEHTNVYASAGELARLTVVNGIEPDQSWSTPLPKPKEPEKK